VVPAPSTALTVAVVPEKRKFVFSWGAVLFLISLVGSLLGPAQLSALALSFNVTFDSSTNGAPAGFFPAFNDAIQFYQTTYSDPITINLQVGWGKITQHVGANRVGHGGFECALASAPPENLK
jgi:hypothetical protein